MDRDARILMEDFCVLYTGMIHPPMDGRGNLILDIPRTAGNFLQTIFSKTSSTYVLKDPEAIAPLKTLKEVCEKIIGGENEIVGELPTNEQVTNALNAVISAELVVKFDSSNFRSQNDALSAQAQIAKQETDDLIPMKREIMAFRDTALTHFMKVAERARTIHNQEIESLREGAKGWVAREEDRNKGTAGKRTTTEWWLE